MFAYLRRQSKGSITSRFILVFFVVVVLFGWLQRQTIYDQIRLRSFEPTSEIEQLAFDTTMNNSAKKIFYINHPQLDDRSEFNENCSGFGEHTIVLGCYISHQGIYLFKIDDERLEGVEQVTAAHEMLHAAYDRLSSKDQIKVNNLTSKAFSQIIDQRLKNSIENYRSRDPSVVPNELHSILGTEVRNLPPELEEYYKRYFTNRHAIVAYSERYESVLIERNNKAASLELQISGLKNEIDHIESSLGSEKNQLQQQRENVHNQKQANAYNQLVDAYNSNIQLLNEKVDEYNGLVQEYKKVALDAQSLYKSLDSRPEL